MKHVHCLTLSALLLAGSGAAQEVLAGAAPQDPTISLQFSGGSLEQLIAEIRKAAGGANIIASAAAKEVELPPITLRSATVGASLMAVRSIVPEPYRVNVETQRDIGLPVHSVTVVTFQRPETTGVGPFQARGVRVFSIRSLVEALPSDPPGFADKLLGATAVLSAVENGLQVSRAVSEGRAPAAGKGWDMRYHEDSRLLFVSGSHEQVALVGEVLGALERDATRAREAAHRASLEKADEAKSTGKDR